MHTRRQRERIRLMNGKTRRIILAHRPTGALQPEDLSTELVEMPPVPVGGLSLKTHYLSVDPFLRLLLDEKVLGGVPGLAVGAMIPGAAVSEVGSYDHPGD